MIPYEKHCLDNAKYFTAVRGSKSSNRIRKEFDDINSAIEFAQSTYGDRRTMIYAVTDTGSAAHIQNA
tara:strand:+ start:6386 stop:6589 length:204 start_codon:yes stop_codon:yes gene_type:complete